MRPPPCSKEWRSSFVDGLARSRAFLPIVSRAAVAGWESIEADAECDNVLLEHRLALELAVR